MGNKKYNNRGAKSALNKRMAIKFFTIVFGSVAGFILISSIAVFAFLMPTYSQNFIIDPGQGSMVPVIDRPTNVLQQHFSVPVRTTFLVAGLDDSNLRGDVIIVGAFNRVTNSIDLISIPRDTIVFPSAATIAYLSENGRNVPTQTKFTDLFAHGGVNHGVSAVRRHTEEFLGISIDYEVIVNLNAFRAIVDAVGGVTMEIPTGGFFYDPPDQDFVINIPAGIQHLDGRMAEGVVRYRSSYARADLQRIEMQQQFMNELFRQTLQRDTIMRNAYDILLTLIEYVETDFPPLDIIRYLPFITRLNETSINTTTLPGAHEIIWSPTGGIRGTGGDVSYVVTDMAATREIVDRVFFSSNEEVQEDYDYEASDLVVEATPEPIRNIRVLNGGNQVGEAGRTRDMLIEQGFNVVGVGDYTGSQVPNTRIIVREQGMGENLRRHFTNPIFQVNANMEAGYDIIIITGSATT